MNKDMDRSKAKERYAAGKMRQHSTRALFFIGGFGAASWAPLIPLLRERLAIGEDVLGMMLFILLKDEKKRRCVISDDAPSLH